MVISKLSEIQRFGEYFRGERMIYYRGDKVIEVSKIEFAGKRPSMFIGRNNKLYKVASFSSDESAKAFCDFLDEFLELENSCKK